MRGKFAYFAVMSLALIGWFAKNTEAPAAAPKPSGFAGANIITDPQYIGLDIEKVSAGGQCNLEYVNNIPMQGSALPVKRSAPLQLVGWAFGDIQSGLPKMVLVVFTSADNAQFFVLAKRSLPRTDVQQHLKLPDSLVDSGFEVDIQASAIPEGEYALSTLISYEAATYTCDNGRKILVQ